MRCFGAAAPLVLALSACIIGDGGDVESPYDGASIEVSSADGVADGLTAVTVTVTGQPGTTLVLVVTRAAFELADDAESPTEKTVFVGSDGSASATIVSTAAGNATVAFKPDPRKGARSVLFHRVRMAAGAGRERSLAPGQVVRDVCVAVTSPSGMLLTGPLTADEEDAAASVEVVGVVEPTEPPGLDCPTAAVDPIGWRGYAQLRWTSRAGDGTVDINFANDAGASSSETVRLRGEPFAGYGVVAGSPVVGAALVTVDLTVSYLAVGGLPGGPAADVALESRFLPDPGPTYLGSSTAGASDPAVTSDDGTVTLFFDAGQPGSYAWFVTPSGGSPVQLPDLEIPDPL